MIDSHAHLGDDAFTPDLHQVLKRAQNVGITHILDICTDEKTLTRGLVLKKQHPWILLAAATTPHDVEREDLFPLVEKNLPHLDAIGETGLDYFYQHSPKELQQEHLRRYLTLAKTHSLPIIIHCRDAFSDFYRIYDENPCPGTLHCFTGTLAEAKAGIERNLLLSFSGILTFKKSQDLQNTAKQIPLDHILIETDSPYLAPQGHRGKRNEPVHVLEVAKTLATLKDLPLQQVLIATTHNFTHLMSN